MSGTPTERYPDWYAGGGRLRLSPSAGCWLRCWPGRRSLGAGRGWDVPPGEISDGALCLADGALLLGDSASEILCDAPEACGLLGDPLVDVAALPIVGLLKLRQEVVLCSALIR